ncbi:MAG: hypothetical protein IKB54_05365 [Clostridia bacterium]|nr:hypothetical protein [Clostridia bacterium]
MSKWKVRWTINYSWGEISDFDSETFDNFDSAKAKFYEKMEGGVCDSFFWNYESAVREDLDEDGEDGEAIVQYIKDFFCGNLTQEDSLVVDYSGEDFNLCINKRGINMEESANCFYLDGFLTIQTDFLTVDDEDKNYTLYVYDPYYATKLKKAGLAIVVLEKI